MTWDLTRHNLDEDLEWYRTNFDEAHRNELKAIRTRLKAVYDGLINVVGKIRRLERVIEELAVEHPGLYCFDGRSLDEYLVGFDRPAIYNPRDRQRWKDEILFYAERLKESSNCLAEAEISLSSPILGIVAMSRSLSRPVTYKELANLFNEELGDLGRADKPVTEKAVRQHVNRLMRKDRQRKGDAAGHTKM